MSVNTHKNYLSGILPGKSFPNNDQSFPMVHYILRVQHLQKSSEKGGIAIQEAKTSSALPLHINIVTWVYF